jgi:hypothetical protein
MVDLREGYIQESSATVRRAVNYAVVIDRKGNDDENAVDVRYSVLFFLFTMSCFPSLRSYRRCNSVFTCLSSDPVQEIAKEEHPSITTS